MLIYYVNPLTLSVISDASPSLFYRSQWSGSGNIGNIVSMETNSLSPGGCDILQHSSRNQLKMEVMSAELLLNFGWLCSSHRLVDKDNGGLFYFVKKKWNEIHLFFKDITVHTKPRPFFVLIFKKCKRNTLWSVCEWKWRGLMLFLSILPLFELFLSFF